ncbi:MULTISPECIES: anthranilate synthase component II [Pasteurellaceae]|uniref:Glutamine amidotransferase, class I n=1 Tax=Pasteurella bettyae CCUG 2042 TaxID=1095749 RepID=I3D9Z4_9PAST|nr:MULTISPECIES: anthranilate synthase component II [Pasteurellaceae]EIJ68537.1 glutamine amidotransferase, class I [Pasteurella bettyae CCUG 2042]SUB22770.1 putative anthranilate synthase component II [Pasteurella bettyae]
MEKRLLIINNHDSFTYNLVDLLRRLCIPMEIVNVELLNLDEVDAFSHILISPGPDVPEAYPQLFACLARYHQCKSILGVCLGHQTLCQFFGAHLYNLAEVRHGVSGNLKVRCNSGIFSGLPKQFKVGLYHSWAVDKYEFPEQLKITAECHDGVIMAFQHKTLPIYGVQFHPESYISEYGEQLLTNWFNG